MKETILKNYKHNKSLAEGKFQEADFDFKLGTGEGGRTQMGEMSPERKQLIISDAKERLNELIKKFPWLEEDKKEDKKVNFKNKTKKEK